MSRLKHPVRAIREPFGKAGLTVAILALVLAMVGGAYAAGGLTKAQEKQVTKIAKKYAGKPGASGANGTNGSNGATGAKGDKGDPGTNGAPGVNGKSVKIGATAPGCVSPGVTGGKTIEVEGEASTKQNVCNGKEGSPWTAGGTLPSKSTEKGTWAVTAPVGPFGPIYGSISFTIPLAKRATAEYVTSPTLGCPGSPAAPTAEPGFFCVYVQFPGLHFGGFANLEEVNAPTESTKFGDLLVFENEVVGEPESAYGSWAVAAG